MANRYPKSIKEAVELLNPLAFLKRIKKQLEISPNWEFHHFISPWAIISEMNLDYGETMRSF